MNAGGLLYSLVPVLLYCYAVYMYISVVYVSIPVSSLTFLFRKGVVANPRSAVASLAVARVQRRTHFAVVGACAWWASAVRVGATTAVATVTMPGL